VCNKGDFDHLDLLPEHRSYVDTELELWHRCYLPIGNVVLDLGAGCGETAQFYLNHGAKRVIAIESNPDAYKLLVKNFAHEDRVVCVSANIDSVKMDIEGAEKNMILETHFFPLLKHLHTLRAQGSGVQATIWKLEGFPYNRSLRYHLHKAKNRIAHTVRITIDTLRD
jgi:hypothetical protein